MQIEFSHLGKIIDLYEGKGIMIIGDQFETECNYKIAQFVDGDIRVYIETKIYKQLKDSDFSIKTEDEIFLFENVLVLNQNIQSNKGTISCSYFILITKLQTIRNNFHEDKFRCEFYLTNIMFSNSFNIEFENYTAKFLQIRDYVNISKVLKWNKKIDVTAKLVIEPKSIIDVEEIIADVDDLEELLTFALGCRISWIKYDVIDNNDRNIKTIHGCRITRNYSNFRVICEKPNTDIQNFIHAKFNHFKEIKEKWKLHEVISTLTEGKVEGDLLENRALKIAISVEILKNAFIESFSQEYIIDEEIWDSKKLQLKKGLKETFKGIFENVKSNEISTIVGKMNELNRFPFKRYLQKIIKEININITDEEINKFILIRNNLVHTGRFIKNENYFNQYKSLMNFANKIILGILEYDGYYYDYSKPYGWIGENMEMRQKMKYIN